MNEQKLKSIASALSGAIMVLLVTLMVLMFTKGDSNKEPDRKKIITKVESVPVKEKIIETKTEVSQREAGEDLKEVFDTLGVLDSKNEISADEFLEKRSGGKDLNLQKNDALVPIEESITGSELDELDSLIADQKEKFREKEQKSLNRLFEEEPEKEKEPPAQKISRKEVHPDEVKRMDDVERESRSAIEKMISGTRNLFDISEMDFNKEWMAKTNSIWNDNIKSSARSVSAQEFAGIVSLETVFTFRHSKLNKITLMVYNKGDIGNITETSFNKVKDDVLNKMIVHAGKKPKFKPNAGITRNNIYFWLVDNILYKLEYSETKTAKTYQSEYIRVVISKGNPGINVINIDKANTDVITEADLRNMVTKKANGDVIIEGIPMVDQGKKGYCACAALARLMMYFGRDFDQHDIAKLAASTGSQGSDPKSLKKAIETMSAMLRLNMKVLAKCHMSDTRPSKMKDMLEQMKRQRVSYEEDIPIFKELAFKDRRYKEFEKNIITAIDRGRPVAWALEVGMVPEKDIPQASGGHMRIITGYNKMTGKLYYTDTWGAGHEKKSMDMTSAFFVSYAVWEISPR